MPYVPFCGKTTGEGSGRIDDAAFGGGGATTEMNQLSLGAHATCFRRHRAPNSRDTTWDAIGGSFGVDVADLDRALERVFVNPVS